MKRTRTPVKARIEYESPKGRRFKAILEPVETLGLAALVILGSLSLITLVVTAAGWLSTPEGYWLTLAFMSGTVVTGLLRTLLR